MNRDRVFSDPNEFRDCIQPLCLGGSSVLHVSALVERFENGAILTGLVLHLDSASITLLAMEDDSISASIQDGHAVSPGEMSSEPALLWKSIVGMELLWVWTMTNQQGYWDGLQIEFSDRGGESGCLFQVVVCAGMLIERRVETFDSMSTLR